MSPAPTSFCGIPMQNDPDFMRAEVQRVARSWLGAPWRHQGRGPKDVDCVGLLVMIGRELSIPHQDFMGYGRQASGANFLRPFEASLESVPISDARPGDVIVLRDGLYPCHCGVLGWKDGEMTLIHAHAPRRRVIEEPLSDEWKSKRVAAFMFPVRPR